jgi:hypothetical protein
MIQVNLEQLERLALQLPEQERMQLIESLRKSLADHNRSKPLRDLRGIWKDKVPSDFDIDAALREIRSEWKHKFEQDDAA